MTLLHIADIWMFICGVCGLLIALFESRRGAPRIIALATAAWMVVLVTSLLISWAIVKTRTEVDLVEKQVEENRKLLLLIIEKLEVRIPE